jgi:hypothetical protein
MSQKLVREFGFAYNKEISGSFVGRLRKTTDDSE